MSILPVLSESWRGRFSFGFGVLAGACACVGSGLALAAAGVLAGAEAVEPDDGPAFDAFTPAAPEDRSLAFPVLAATAFAASAKPAGSLPGPFPYPGRLYLETISFCSACICSRLFFFVDVDPFPALSDAFATGTPFVLDDPDGEDMLAAGAAGAAGALAASAAPASALVCDAAC